MPGLLGDPAQGGGGLLSNFFTGLQAQLAPNAYQAQLGQQTLQAQYQAYQQAGVPEPLARIFALNPEAAKQYGGAYLDQAPKIAEGGTDPFSGQKNFVIQRQGPNPSVTAAPIQAPGGGAAAPPNTTETMFNNIEQGKAAGQPIEQLLQNVPNSLRNAVDAMIKGKAIPANFSFRGQSRDMAVRLAHALDADFDETKIPMRAVFAHGMGQTTPNSNGGQKLLLNTALQHAAEMSDALVDLHNTGGPFPDVPGTSYLANAYNSIKNTSSTQGGTVNRLGDIAQKLSGELGKLYSGSTGGGETERQATVGRFSKSNTPQESIGGMEATRNLVLDKLNSLQNQRDQAYGSAGENIYPLLDAQTKKALEKIDANIAKLRGGAVPQGQPQQGALPQGWKYLGTK